MSEQFKQGDRVILKSGGPVMTVKEVKEQTIVCEWYESGKGFQIREFDPEELKFVAPTRIKGKVI